MPNDDDDGDVDQGPDLNELLDRQLTLTPDTHIPAEFTDKGYDKPPDLPPKVNRKQNGMVGHDETRGESSAVDSAEPPEVPPRREKKEKDDSTVSHHLLTHYQTTNSRLFQTERVCRQQFQI